MSIDVSIDIFIDMLIDAFIDISIDMLIDVSIDMFIDILIGIWTNILTDKEEGGGRKEWTSSQNLTTPHRRVGKKNRTWQKKSRKASAGSDRRRTMLHWDSHKVHGQRPNAPPLQPRAKADCLHDLEPLSSLAVSEAS